MNRINVGRVIVGGVVAGVVLFFMLGGLHHKLLMVDWEAWKGSVSGVLQLPPPRHSMKLWLAMSLVAGVTGTWIYAGIRPRFGAGHKTALLAGFLLWLAGPLPGALNALALGVLPHHIIKVALGGELVAFLVSTYIGAAIYKE